ncbi:hypothetical protein BDW59DRAFT_160121 [Aspergillus cavernicola]|uniref:Cytochrome P450 n=1 Tax=Aspergillus cavernicola TaxID=176166 RepID=A0ABR4IJ66_9EURO
MTNAANSYQSYLPEWLAPFKKEGQRPHALEHAWALPHASSDGKVEVKAGVAGASFVRTWLESKESFGLTDDEAAYVLGPSMVLFPQWQQAMCDELDGVVGDHMPEFEDVPKLPMCRARFYLTNKTIHRDPDRRLNPNSLTYREPRSKYPSLQNFSSFGFGRHICPGMNIAERSLYILPARIMWACRIIKKDADGVKITPPLYDYTTGSNTQSKQFPFRLEARSEERRVIVEEVWMERQRGDPLAGTVNYKLGHSLGDLDSVNSM